MIEIINISKNYSNSKVLDNINLKLPSNSITGIIGPNGAGKSTLLKIISLIEKPDTGNIKLDGENIEDFNQIKDKIYYMPEFMTLYPEYYVNDFIDFFQKTINYEDMGLLDNLSLKQIYKKKIKNLSKGWHQRLKLYISLCNKRNIIILDEPFDGFDPIQLNLIIDIFKEQRMKGRTFILSIHQLSYAQKICDYFVLLNSGKIIEKGTYSELKKKYNCKNGSIEEIFIKAIKE